MTTLFICFMVHVNNVNVIIMIAWLFSRWCTDVLLVTEFGYLKLQLQTIVVWNSFYSEFHWQKLFSWCEHLNQNKQKTRRSLQHYTYFKMINMIFLSIPIKIIELPFYDNAVWWWQ